MTLATILIIILSPGNPPTGYGVALPSHDACEVAMEAAFATLHQHYPDMELYCRDSTILWSSPLPKERKE